MIQAVDRLLASVFYRQKSQQSLATNNGLRLKAHRNVFLEESDKKLWGHVQTYLLKQRASPSHSILKSLAEEKMDSESLVRLESVTPLEVCSEEEFQHFLGMADEEVRKNEVGTLFSRASQILSGTYRPKKGEPDLRGPRDALQFALEKSVALIQQDSRGLKLSGDIRKEGEEMIREYEEAEADPGSSVGILTGLDEIDLMTNGIKRGDLWLIAGYTSEGKTTTCLNIAHHAVCNGFNVFFASMEMSRVEIRRTLYGIHTSHKKFQNIHPPIPLKSIERGLLTPEQKDFYYGQVIEDFTSNPSYGKLEVTQPTEIWSAEILQAQAELCHKRMPGGLDLVIPDYIGLMKAEGRSEGRNEDLNRIIRGLKNMALTFSGGDQIPILSPFQCNRDGWRRACENNGEYDLTALSSAHEAERSSDVIMTIFMSKEMKANHSAKLCQLKGRKTGCADPKEIHADMETRIVRENAPSRMALESANWMDNLMAGI